MSSTDSASRPLAVALLYQAEALHQHLRSALTDLGATLVYESATAEFDRARLDASGAQVVVVNLDPQVDEEIDQIDALLDDDRLRVIFNDGEVSSKLEGWDAARWARHLAAKILGVREMNPPRPAGSEAVSVRVRQAAPERPTAALGNEVFELSGDEIARALAADTSESLAHAREQLTTKLEPISPDLIAQEQAIAPYQSTVEQTSVQMPEPIERLPAQAPEVPRDSNRAAVGEDFAASELEAALKSFDFGGSAAAAPAPEEEEGFDLTELAAFADIDFDAPDTKTGAAEVPVGLDDMLASLQRAEEGDSAPPSVLPKRAIGELPAAPRSAPPPARKPAGAAFELAPDGAPAAARKAPGDKENPFATLLGDLDLSLAPVEEGHVLIPEVQAAPPKADLGQFDLGSFSLEPLPGEEPQAPITGRAKFEIDVPKKTAPAPRPAPAAPPPPAKPIESRFSLAPMDEPQVDAGFEALPPVKVAPLAQVAPAEEDFLGEFAALFAEDVDALGTDAAHLRHVVVLGASIGGPEAVREFLGEIAPSTPVTFLLAQHLGEDFVEMMVQQLARATRLKVRMVHSGDKINPGEVVVVPATERLLLDRAGEVRLENLPEPSPYSPSIDQVLFDIADRFGADASAIIFSGMAHDAIEGAKYLAARGGSVWAQDPATCVVSSMIDGAREAGVVELLGTPKDLAHRLSSKFSA